MKSTLSSAATTSSQIGQMKNTRLCSVSMEKTTKKALLTMKKDLTMKVKEKVKVKKKN